MHDLMFWMLFPFTHSLCKENNGKEDERQARTSSKINFTVNNDQQ
jgi:hypothetical protein